MKNLLLTIAIIFICGCARFHGKQTDISITTNTEDPKIVTKREITTDLKGSAWFSSKQDLAKFSAIQTDKSQAFNGSGLNQRGATNTVATIEALTKLVEAAGVKSISGL
jgi:hypothetical protein